MNFRVLSRIIARHQLVAHSYSSLMWSMHDEFRGTDTVLILFQYLNNGPSSSGTRQVRFFPNLPSQNSPTFAQPSINPTPRANQPSITHLSIGFERSLIISNTMGPKAEEKATTDLIWQGRHDDRGRPWQEIDEDMASHFPEPSCEAVVWLPEPYLPFRVKVRPARPAMMAISARPENES